VSDQRLRDLERLAETRDPDAMKALRVAWKRRGGHAEHPTLARIAEEDRDPRLTPRLGDVLVRAIKEQRKTVGLLERTVEGVARSGRVYCERFEMPLESGYPQRFKEEVSPKTWTGWAKKAQVTKKAGRNV